MNPTASYQLTLIVPVYNERENLQRLEERLSAYLAKSAAAPACVLFVDDGSTDGGSPLLAELCRRHADFFYLRFAHNCGLSAALKAGIDACQSPLLGYIDADLQTDPDDFDLLIPHAGEYELVTGIRVNRRDGFVKRISSKIANGWRRMMTHDGVADTGCPLKILHTATAKKLPLFTGMHRFLPALVQMTGGRVKQVPVRHYPRVAGKAKYHLLNRLWGPFNDCFAFRWMKKRYIDYRVEDDNLR
ncbi:MAG: glycosyltransferase [Bacteroidales bacterium]|nr:glycosyltransferase [Bacteroidales bacterium]MBQ4013445.1 glycosyltransferase [Bacteroidales bacterium]